MELCHLKNRGLKFSTGGVLWTQCSERRGKRSAIENRSSWSVWTERRCASETPCSHCSPDNVSGSTTICPWFAHFSTFLEINYLDLLFFIFLVWFAWTWNLNEYHFLQVDGCFGSGLFHAFSHHVLHRLGVVQEGPIKDQLRVTLLSRSTKFRRILNENEVSQDLCVKSALVK